jgi:hypothetical protein
MLDLFSQEGGQRYQNRQGLLFHFRQREHCSKKFQWGAFMSSVNVYAHRSGLRARYLENGLHEFCVSGLFC